MEVKFDISWKLTSSVIIICYWFYRQWSHFQILYNQHASHDVFFFSKCCYEPISMSFEYTPKTFMQFADYIWCMNDGYVEIIKWILIMCILHSICRTYFLRQVEYIIVLDDGCSYHNTYLFVRRFFFQIDSIYIQFYSVAIGH